MFDLPTHPDGNFYSIPETNEMIRKLMAEIDLLQDSVSAMIENSYQLESKAISENEDLNNLTTAGNYYSGSSTVTSSLSHKPTGVTAAFAMTVLKLGEIALIQTIYYASKIYSRRKTTSGFSSWNEYSGTSQS